MELKQNTGQMRNWIIISILALAISGIAEGDSTNYCNFCTYAGEFPLSLWFCNPPRFASAYVEPVKVVPGDVMLVHAEIYDIYGVAGVTADMGGIENIALNLKEGDTSNGIWEGIWEVHSTEIKDYNTTIVATNVVGLSSFVVLVWSDPSTADYVINASGGNSTFTSGALVGMDVEENKLMINRTISEVSEFLFNTTLPLSNSVWGIWTNNTHLYLLYSTKYVVVTDLSGVQIAIYNVSYTNEPYGIVCNHSNWVVDTCWLLDYRGPGSTNSVIYKTNNILEYITNCTLTDSYLRDICFDDSNMPGAQQFRITDYNDRIYRYNLTCGYIGYTTTSSWSNTLGGIATADGTYYWTSDDTDDVLSLVSGSTYSELNNYPIASLDATSYSLTTNSTSHGFPIHFWSVYGEKKVNHLKLEYDTTPNRTATYDLITGTGNSIKNATITFTSNSQTIDLWSNCSGSWMEHNTSIVSGTNYDISGSEQNCSIRLETTGTASTTPTIDAIEIWFGTAIAGDSTFTLTLNTTASDENTNVSRGWVYMNAYSDENIDTCLIEWDGVNESGTVSGMVCYLNKTVNVAGTYTWKIFANDSSDNWNNTGEYTTDVNCTTPTNDLYINTNTTLCSGTYYINDSGSSGVLIVNASNIKLDCNNAVLIGNGTGSGYGIYWHTPIQNNLTFVNCDIRNYSYGIFGRLNQTSSDEYIVMENNSFSYNNRSIWLDWCDHGIFRYNAFSHTETYNIELDEATYNTISFNNFTDERCLRLVNYAMHNNITNNRFINYTGNYYQVMIESYSSNCRVEHNYFENIYTGIEAYGCSNYSTISNNTFTDAAYYGIFLRPATCGGDEHSIIQNNTFQNVTYGISSNEGHHANIFGNSLNGSGTSSGFGIDFTTVRNNTAYDNTITDYYSGAAYAFRIRGANDSNFYDNSFYHNRHTIALRYVSYNSIFENSTINWSTNDAFYTEDNATGTVLRNIRTITSTNQDFYLSEQSVIKVVNITTATTSFADASSILSRYNYLSVGYTNDTDAYMEIRNASASGLLLQNRSGNFTNIDFLLYNQTNSTLYNMSPYYFAVHNLTASKIYNVSLDGVHLLNFNSDASGDGTFTANITDIESAALVLTDSGYVIPIFSVSLNSPEDNYNTTDTTPDFNFTVTGNYDTYICELFLNGTGYGLVNNWCYQESTNASHSSDGSCTLNYSGSYSYTGGWSNPLNIIDGNYSTSDSGDADGEYFYMNYSKPVNAQSNSMWTYKTITAYHNESIPSDCWNLNPLQFRIFSRTLDAGTLTLSCWNSSNWITIVSSSGSVVSEEGMLWSIADGNTTNNTETTIQANATVSDGMHGWNINCTVEGITNTSVTRDIYIDTTAPLSDSPADAEYTYGDSATINWILTDEYAPGYYYIERNGTVQNSSTAWLNNTAINVWVNTSGEGTWNYTIYFNDSLGNEGIPDEVIITINSANTAPQAPTINNISGSANDSTISDSTPDIYFSVIDSENLTLSCEVWVNGTSGFGINSSVQNNTNSMISVNSTLGDGTYTFNVNCSDGALTNISLTWTETIRRCECATCAACIASLNDTYCTFVNLTADITNETGTCIDNPANFNNKIFDCQGHAIDGNLTAGSRSVYLNGKENNTIRNCVITEFETGVYLLNSDNNTLANNSMDSDVFSGVFLNNTNNCNISENSLGTNIERGIYFVNSTYNRITENEINQNNLSGIYFSNSSHNNATSNTINNNLWSGIISDDSNNNILCYNNINASTDRGIYINNSADTTVCWNNLTNSGNSGVRSENSNGLIIHNNTAYGNIYYGLYLLQSTDCVVTDNNASDNDFSGIEIEYCYNISVSYNAINDNFFSGILFLGSNNSIVFNNTAESNFLTGIYIQESYYNSIYNNTIESNTQYGMYLNNVDSSNLTDNTVQSNGWHGIYMMNSSTSNIVNSNTFCSNNQDGGNYYDIYDIDANTGDDNTCNTFYNWADTGETIGCTAACLGAAFTVTPNSPANNNYTTDTTPDFNYTVSGDITSYVCNLYINGTGYNSTIAQNGTATVVTANHTITPDGLYGWQVNCTYDGITESSTLRNITIDSTPPDITWISQTPANIDTFNLFPQNLTIVYNVTDDGACGLDTSNLYLHYQTNTTGSGCWMYVNGTCNLTGYQQYSYTANTSDLFNFTLPEWVVYPGTYAVHPTEMRSTVHDYFLLDGWGEEYMGKLKNVLSTKQYNVLAIMLDNASAGNWWRMQVLYCNSSLYCTSLAYLNDSHMTPNITDGYSSYILIPFNIDENGRVNRWAKATPTSYIKIRKWGSPNWYIGMIHPANLLDDDTTQHSTDNGDTWTNITSPQQVIDMHLYQYDSNDTSVYFVNATDLCGNNNCSAGISDLIDLIDLEPNAVEIYSPSNGSYSGDILINYSNSTATMGNSLSFFNITLYYENGTFAGVIQSNNSLNLTYTWNSTGTADGNYSIMVEVCDNESLCTSSQSESFILDNTAPTCTISVTPNDLESNSTGNGEILWNCTDISNISYMVGTRTVDGLLYPGLPNFWSTRIPTNNKSDNYTSITMTEKILRGDMRNEGEEFEFLGIFSDNFSYAASDDSDIRITMTSGSNWRMYNLTAPVKSMFFRNMYFLDRTDILDANLYNNSIYKDNPQLVKYYDVEVARNDTNHTLCKFSDMTYMDTPVLGATETYCNFSYDPTGSIKPEDSPNCVFLTALDTTAIDNTVYTVGDNSYSQYCVSVIDGMIGGVTATEYYYIATESPTNPSSKAYIQKYVNGTSSTNVSFNETNVAWTSSDDGVTWVQAKWTPDNHIFSMDYGDQVQLGFWVNDTLGNSLTNLTAYTDDIGFVNFPITTPTILYYEKDSVKYYDLNETYNDNMTIRIGISIDPDEAGTVNHSLYLCNTDGSVNYTINSTFYSSDDSDISIIFDTTLVSDGTYRMNITAISDNDSSMESFLSLNNFSIDNTLPSISAGTPTTTSGNYSQGYIEMNLTGTDTNLDTCVINLYNSTGGLNQTNSSATSPFYWNITGLSDGTYYLNGTCNDTAGNENSTATYTITLDTTAPIISNPEPNNGSTINRPSSGIQPQNIYITTNEIATCRFSTVAGTAYANMTDFNATNSTAHNLTVSIDVGEHNYYFRCNDSLGNINLVDYWLNFTLQVSGGGGGGGGEPPLPPSAPTNKTFTVIPKDEFKLINQKCVTYEVRSNSTEMQEIKLIKSGYLYQLDSATKINSETFLRVQPVENISLMPMESKEVTLCANLRSDAKSMEGYAVNVLFNGEDQNISISGKMYPYDTGIDWSSYLKWEYLLMAIPILLIIFLLISLFKKDSNGEYQKRQTYRRCT